MKQHQKQHGGAGRDLCSYRLRAGNGRLIRLSFGGDCKAAMQDVGGVWSSRENQKGRTSLQRVKPGSIFTLTMLHSQPAPRML
jgi:hypothetical protein